MPQWRVGQAEVPRPVEKPAVQVEAERQAADLIAKRIEEPVALKPVAANLSASLGAPEHPIPAETKTEDAAKESLEDLQAGMAKLQAAVVAQNRILARYAGKEIEGTGINLFGPGVTAVVLGLIVLAVVFPPLATILFFMLRRVGGAMSATVAGVEDFIQARQDDDAVKELKAALSKRMDTAHKAIVRKLKP